MAIITLLSGSGAPGVTTSALALALSWPNPAVLVEADPSGSAAIQSGYLRGEAPRRESIADLAIAQRSGQLAEHLPGAMIRLTDTVQLIPGVRSHRQAVRGLVPVWHPLAAALAAQSQLGVDAIVDAGRLGMAGHPGPLVHASDLVLLVARSTLPAIAGIRSWATQLREEFTDLGSPDTVGLLLIGAGHPYSAREIATATRLPIVATLPLDPVSAEVYSLGSAPGRRHARSGLVRALPSAVEAIRSHLEGTLAILREDSHA